MLSHPSLKQVHQVVSHLLDRTDELFRSGFEGELTISHKNNTQPATSIVTQVDGQIEALISQELQQRYPDIGFIGEETEITEGGKLTWVIDPVDGTYNFARRIPICATSITLWHADRPIYAQISLPLQRRRVASWIGGGVRLADQPVVAWQRPELVGAVISHSGSAAERAAVLEAIGQLGWESEYWGSSVYAAAAMASSIISLNVELRVSLWDLAAKWLFAQELGLHTRFLSKPPDLVADDVKHQRYSLVLGPTDLVEMAVKQIQRLPVGSWGA